MYPINSTSFVRKDPSRCHRRTNGGWLRELTVSSDHHWNEEPRPCPEQMVGMQASDSSVQNDEDDRRRHGGVVEVGLPVFEAAGHLE